jgi:hypothetical protein
MDIREIMLMIVFSSILVAEVAGFWIAYRHARQTR